MSSKLISCLVAACVVIVGGVYLHHGNCPFGGSCQKDSASCPSSVCTLEATGACCDSDEASPCCAKASAVSKKACCDSDVVSSQDSMVAAFGAAAASGTK